MIPDGCSLVIDVSVCQSAPDWDAVVRDGALPPDAAKVIGAIAKATEGNSSTPDPTFLRNWKEIGARDFALRGAYGFGHPDFVHAQDAVAEAETFVRAIEAAGGFRAGRDVAALDSEDGTPLRGEAYVRWCVDWLERTEALTGAVPGEYVGGPYYAQHAVGVSKELVERLARFWLWSPAYVASLDAFIASPWSMWKLRQVGGDVVAPGQTVLHVAGIGGGKVAVDRDLFRGTANDLRAWVASLADGPSFLDEFLSEARHVAEAIDSAIADIEHDTDPSPPPPTSDAPTWPGTPRSKSSQRLRALADVPIIGVDADPHKEDT